MSYPRILSKVFHSAWAIHKPMLGSILTVLTTRLAADQAAVSESLGSADGLPANKQAGAPGGRAGQFRTDRLAVDRFGELVNFSARAREAGLKAHYAGGSYSQAYTAELATAPEGQTLVIFGSGILGKHLDSMEEMCAGGLSVDKIQAALAEARDDVKVASVVLHLDTPGGMVYGIAETAALVRQISEIKPVVGLCDSQTASAGYWILAACDQIYVTPSADLGCIGIYAVHLDYTEWLKKEGIAVDLISDGGTHKGAGVYGIALTPEQRAKIQEEVMACSAMFKGFVSAQRPGVTADTMQGQCYFGQAAVDKKLADSLVNSLEDVLREIVSPAAA